jgi:predicted peroxiredoxin
MADWKEDGSYEQVFIKRKSLVSENFSQMYDYVYATFVMANVATKIDNEEWVYLTARQTYI